jgi:GT2 family glycosyltransferase
MKISIIIPVYNNIQLTKGCLESIVSQSFYLRDMEVIIIDDCSNDGTKDYAEDFQRNNNWLIYHRNPTNLKFARSCNTGANMARGEFLIFLNNDTLVTKDWDKILLDTLDADRNTWMAGAKLLYPDSTIQHAGVYLPEFTGKSFGHVYSGFPSDFPPANGEKELQCVTAACMMMRRDDFLSLGGFDASYLNGSEDIDLCLRIIEKGKKIVYQPGCEIIHFESKSEGRFEHAKSNSELLFRRWKGRVKPDMFDLIGHDLKTCKENGSIIETRRFSGKTGWKELRELNPDLEINPAGNIGCHPQGLPLFFPVPEKKDADNGLMIGIECVGGDKIPALLGYDTKAGYKNGKILNTVRYIYRGRNHLLFALKTEFISNTASVRFENKDSSVEISSLAFYTFKTRALKKPLLSVIYHPASDPGTVNDLVRNFQENRSGLEIELVKAVNEMGPKYLNNIISSSGSDYYLVLKDGVAVLPHFAVHAVEIMELQPRIGFVYSDATIQKGDTVRTVRFDFNPVNILVKTKADTTGIFRRKCWEDAQGYDESLTCFVNTDLFLGALSTGNWKSHRITYPALVLTGNLLYTSTGCQAEADHIRSKHEIYLQKEMAKLSQKEKDQIVKP